MSSLPNEIITLALGTRRLVRPNFPGVIMIGTQGLRGPQGVPGLGFKVYDTKVEMDADTGPGIAYCSDYPDQYWKWVSVTNSWEPAF